MSEPSVVHNTFVIERNYPVTPERLFHAFSDPATKQLWYTENPSHDVEKFDMDFRVGGLESTSYRFNSKSPFPGAVLTNDVTFLDIVADKRIVMGSAMALAGRTFSASLVTIEFVPASAGTDLICTHQGAFFENSDGPEMRQRGWTSLFEKLFKQMS